MLEVLERLLTIGVLLWAVTPSTHGQKATEMFIPIGQSPGLSNKISLIGTIESIDARTQTIAVARNSETWSVLITDRTMIWLDRSALRLPSQKGSFPDLKPELLAEVKYEESAGRSGAAEWIKVKIIEPGG